MSLATVVLIGGGKSPFLPRHLSEFLPAQEGCMFPRSTDPVAYSAELPCSCCNGTGKLIATHWLYSNQEVECWACGGLGTSMVAYDEEQAYVASLMYSADELYMNLPDAWPEEEQAAVPQVIPTQQPTQAGAAA